MHVLKPFHPPPPSPIFHISTHDRMRLSIAQDIAAGMHSLYAHGMQHRHLSSSSVLLTSDWRAKVRYIRGQQCNSRSPHGSREGSFSWLKLFIIYQYISIYIVVRMLAVHAPRLTSARLLGTQLLILFIYTWYEIVQCKLNRAPHFCPGDSVLFYRVSCGMSLCWDTLAVRGGNVDDDRDDILLGRRGIRPRGRR